MARFLNHDEARAIARRRLPRGLFDYIDRGVGAEASLRALWQSLDDQQITPRVLSGQAMPDLACRLFGRDHAAPLVIAPTAMAGLLHPAGEAGLARAAGAAGIPFSLSTQSISGVDEIARAAPDTEIWMQLYLWRDLAHSEGLMRRAADAGVRVLVMTVDTPAGSRKEWNIRSGFDMPFRPGLRSLSDLALRPGWLARVIAPQLLRGGMPRMMNYPPGRRPALVGRRIGADLALMPGLDWGHVAWVRARWKGSLVLKGILAPEDAERARQEGADGIVVSSHGARNFDAAPPPIKVLPAIASANANVGAQGPALTVMADGGIRRGLDVLRYRRAGAHAVMLGRLPLWALAAGGERGVACALQILRDEYAEALRYAPAMPG